MPRYTGVLVGTMLLVALAAPGTAAAKGMDQRPPPPCQFILGFATLRALIPQQVGLCIDDEQHDPITGDGIQHTTGGLLVWRKLDNWTAFTDGYNTWVNGPNGLQERLNDQRFSWEPNPTGLPVVS